MAEYTDATAPAADEAPDSGKSGKSDKDILLEARQRMKECIDRESDNRLQQLDDQRFATLDQWPAAIRNQREKDINGARPCLTIDKTNQYITQVVNDMRQNRPAIKVRPVDDEGDVEVAKVLQEKCRHIEDLSSAQVAYLNAGESAVRIGDGYFRILTEYESETSSDQEICIRRCPDAFSVYLGPHIMPDGSDAEYGFIFEDVPLDTFKRQFPGKKFAPADFEECVTTSPEWRTEQAIRVAEYFYFDYQKKDLLFLDNGSYMLEEDYVELPEPRLGAKFSRETQVRTTKWCKLTGAEVLKKEDFPSKYIPIIKVVGREAIVDGKRVSWGLIRPAKDSLRMYNYWASTITEKISLAPKAPFIGAVGQFATHEDKWGKANTTNFSRLEYDPIDVNGQMVPPPQRQAPAPVEAAMLNMLPLIEHDVQTSLGMFKASVGQTEGDQSGRALLALQRESDTGTFHFPDNLNLSIRHCGRIVVDMIPRVHDVKKLMRLVGEDGQTRQVAIDPEQNEAMREVKGVNGAIQKIYNPGVGRYDVTVTSGPSYNTKRMEAVQVFSELAKGATDPQSAAVLRYLTVKNSDMTSSDEALHMLKAMIPPAVIPPEDGAPQVPPQVIAQMSQMKQMLDMAGQKIQELESGQQTDMAKVKASHDAAMEKLDLEAVAESRRQALERERFEFEKRLEIDKANHAAWLAEQKVAGEQDSKKKQMAFDRECAERDAVETDAKTITPVAKQLTTNVEQIMLAVKQIEETVEGAKPVSVKTIKDAAGHIIGGVATYASGDTQRITIQ